jgi:hypothetical protein
MRLFRQCQLGNWETVFASLAQELTAMLSSSAARQAVAVEIAPGELIDKITILQIKRERLTDAAKLQNVECELTALTQARDRVLPASTELDRLTAELKSVNEALWRIEDDIRDCERRQDFGTVFTELARSVYHQNDRRAALKRRINELLGSRFVEEKSYTDYRRQDGGPQVLGQEG